MKHILKIITLLWIVLLLLAGCSGDSGSRQTSYIRGWAFAEKPISGATVNIYATQKNNLIEPELLSTSASQTDDQGTFLVRVSSLPGNFRVVARNGEHREQSFGAELKADVEDFDPTRDIVYVNVVTTMISTYRDRHPGTALAEATAKVKDFLAIPGDVDVGEGLQNSGQYFSHMVFLLEAEGHGGVSRYIDMLLEEIQNHPEKKHPFYALQLFTDDTSGIVAKIGDKLVEGALSYAGGKLFGWSLKKFGGVDLEGGPLKEVQKSLEEIKTMLTELSNKMDRNYEQLSAQITQTDYNMRVGQITPLINIIKTTSDSIMFLTSLTPTEANKSFIETEKKRIEFIIGTQIMPQAWVINDQLVGTAGAEGLLKVWSRVVKNKHRFLGTYDSKQIWAQFDYFDAVQLSIIELVIEYYHATDAPKEVILAAIEKYKTNRKAQLAIRPLLIPEGAVVETHSGLMIYPLDVWNAYKFATGDMFWDWWKGVEFWYYGFYLNKQEWDVAKSVSYNINFDHSGKPLLDYNNWRMPSRSEAQKMFELRTGKGLGTWAVSQGYPKDYINDEMKVFLCDDPFLKLTNGYVYFTKDGTIKANPWILSGVSGSNLGEKKGHLIPVRSLGQVEFYYW